MYSLLFRNRSLLGRLMQLQLKFIILISYWRHCATSPLTSSAVNNDRRANALMYAVLLLLLGGCWYMSLGLLVCLPVCPSPLHRTSRQVLWSGSVWDGMGTCCMSLSSTSSSSSFVALSRRCMLLVLPTAQASGRGPLAVAAPLRLPLVGLVTTLSRQVVREGPH